MGRSVREIRIEGDTAFVTLTKGFVALVDAVDAPLVAGFNWHVGLSATSGSVYAIRNGVRSASSRKKQTIHMHRVLMNAPVGMEVDHIDGDSLNNRRANLRLATHSENQRNQGLSRANKSGFKGVCWDKTANKWRAQIKVHKRNKTLGNFDTPEAAHAAYVNAAHRLHGDFARVG